MPISYERRRANAVTKAVTIIKPYVLKYLSASQSSVLNSMVADPLLEGVRKHFWGFKGGKNEQITKLKLSKAEADRALLRAIRECLQSKTIEANLIKRGRERKAELAKSKFDPWSPDAGKVKTLKRFKPLKEK